MRTTVEVQTKMAAVVDIESEREKYLKSGVLILFISTFLIWINTLKLNNL